MPGGREYNKKYIKSNKEIKKLLKDITEAWANQEEKPIGLL